MSESTTKWGNGNLGVSKGELKRGNLDKWELKQGKGGVKVW